MTDRIAALLALCIWGSIALMVCALFAGPMLAMETFDKLKSRTRKDL